LSESLWALSSQELCATAQRRTSLSDFGEPPLEPALSTLVHSLETEVDLHPLGRFLIRLHLLSLLQTRLRLVNVWREHPETLDSALLERPVFIVGMPRSGSTFLHELLAEDAVSRAPRVWEVMFPVPDPAGGERERRRRIRKTEFCLWWFRRLAPEADSVYPMRAHTPHECVAIHSYTFHSEEFVSTCRVPAYEKYLRAADLAPVYIWQKRFLQSLQFRGKPRRWILKAPDHVHGLEKLFSVFPDARIIQTHRNPLQVLRSSTELTRVLQGLYARPAEPDQVAARETRLLAESTERFLQFRDAHPELADRFVDIKYSELVAEPLAAINQIYQRLDLPLSQAAVTRMRELASKRTRYRGVANHFNLTHLGGEAEAQAQRFERYCARFDLSVPGT
jgi:hypothetical protein